MKSKNYTISLESLNKDYDEYCEYYQIIYFNLYNTIPEIDYALLDDFLDTSNYLI